MESGTTQPFTSSCKHSETCPNTLLSVLWFLQSAFINVHCQRVDGECLVFSWAPKLVSIPLMRYISRALGFLYLFKITRDTEILRTKCNEP